MEIRLVDPEEHAALAELTVEAYRTLYAGADRQMPDYYVDELADVAGRAAASDVLVAVDQGRLLGGVAYVPGPESPLAEFVDADHAGIRMLAVAPAAQGRGVGEALSRACVERARAAGRAAVVLHSTDWMATAHRIYERIGFERVTSLDWEVEPGFWLRGFRLKL
jgi:GNAT superfamily N-acetyltransferase